MKKLNFSLFVLASFFYAMPTINAQESEIATESAQESATPVACLGKISVGDSIARLAAPTLMGNAPIVEKIMVKKGEVISKDQQIALLKGWEKAHASVSSAQAALNSAKSSAAIAVAQSLNEIDDLQGTYHQNLDVLQKNPPRSERERIDYEQRSILRRLAHSKNMLELIKVDSANTVNKAEANLKEAEATAEEFVLKAPFSGEVIEVNVKSGEAVGNSGVCEIADTTTMFVEAEVYVSDIAKVKVGDRALCNPEALPNETLEGEVSVISPYVKNNLIFSQDPSEFADRKVILVKIKLLSSAKVRALIGSPVRVKILVKE